MTTVAQVADVMEVIAPKHLAETWDNPGLLVGDPAQKVQKILVVLDVSERVVDLAVKLSAELIISHHPLIFKPIKKIRTDLPTGKLLKKILTQNLAVFAAHTNLDSALGGVNDVLANRLGLVKVRPLTQAADGEPGLGRIGELESAIGIDDFITMVKDKLRVPYVRLVAGGDGKIKKVAICGGSGAEFIDRAALRGADAYLTGDIRYHDAQRAADLGIYTVDAGHFGTEYPIVHELTVRLGQEMTTAGLSVEIYEDTDAADYFTMR